MELARAIEILSADSITRSELRDHYFNDAEVFWFDPQGQLGIGDPIAGGYFGPSGYSVWINPNPPHGEQGSFRGDEAMQLRKLGTLKNVERNDTSGPTEYQGA